jgi:hypothetical protein
MLCGGCVFASVRLVHVFTIVHAFQTVSTHATAAAVAFHAVFIHTSMAVCALRTFIVCAVAWIHALTLSGVFADTRGLVVSWKCTAASVLTLTHTSHVIVCIISAEGEHACVSRMLMIHCAPRRVFEILHIEISPLVFVLATKLLSSYFHGMHFFEGMLFFALFRLTTTRSL